MSNNLFKEYATSNEEADVEIAYRVQELLEFEKEYTECEQFSLRETKLITDEFLTLIDHPKWTHEYRQIVARQLQLWKLVKKLYESEGGPFVMAFASVANAILTQGRWVFVTSRKNLWQLIKNDKNHNKEFKLEWKKYSALLSYLYKTGLIDRIEKNVGRKAGIFVVKSEMFVQHLFEEILDLEGWNWESPEFLEHKQAEMRAVMLFRDQWKGK